MGGGGDTNFQSVEGGAFGRGKKVEQKARTAWTKGKGVTVNDVRETPDRQRLGRCES